MNGALGELRKIWTYPVKSLRHVEHAQIAIEADGLAGDRRAAFYVVSAEHARSGKSYRGKEDNRLHLIADPDAAQHAAADRGVELESRSGARYFDAGIVSLVLDRWIAEVEAGVGRSLDPLRWRPNLYLRAAMHAAEKDLSGARVAIGDAILRILRPIVRCVVPSYDLETGESDNAVLRFLVQQRDNKMGVYCDVERPGLVRTGDRARLVGDG